MMFGGGMLLTSVVVILGIIYFVKYIADHNTLGEVKNNKNALQILRERYARGEINHDQFKSMKKDLGE